MTLDLASLNEPQRAAVLHDGSPLVVFAGAGSGKTRVITFRIAHLVLERGVPPSGVLAVTFTNKAASEMRERLASLAPAFSRRLRVGTFHSTCARILRQNADTIGLKRDFTIYDDQDQRAMVKRVLKDLGLDPKRVTPKIVANRINRAKQEVVQPEDMPTDDPISEIVSRVYEAYEARMRKAGALDFGDLIYRLVLAIEADQSLRESLSTRFEHIMVDEFQDTNHAQFRLVRALASMHRNLVVVGDDDQCIYRWRGADRRNILDFRRAFPEAQIIKLEQNYRSTKRILRSAHAVIRRNKEREPKELFTDNDEGGRILVVRTEDERDEARMVARAVQSLQEEGDPLSEMVVFYRVHAQSRVIEETLRSANIPYRIVGGTRFYDRLEVKDLLAYLRVLQNKDDDVSLLRIINTPPRGIGKTTIGRLLELAAQSGSGVYAALHEVENVSVFGAAAKKKLGAFISLLNELDRHRDELALSDLGGTIADLTGYRAMLEKENTPESDARLQNIAELFGSMAAFDEELTARREELAQAVERDPLFVDELDREDVAQLASADPLSAFLEGVTLQEEVTQKDALTDRLTLMTVHAAKGLEFPTVFVTGMEEQMFPFKGTDPWEDPEELEEERRLAYVAFTRAEQRLVLSYATRRRIFGQLKNGFASRFLDELPQDDIEQLGQPRKPRAAPAFRADPWDEPVRPAPNSFEQVVSDSWETAQQASEKTHVSEGGFEGDSYLDVTEGNDLYQGGGIRKGMRVRHPRFGVGKVLTVSGGVPPRVTVRFPGGDKQIVATYLQPA